MSDVLIRCHKCAGSGKYFGGGMIQEDCDVCINGRVVKESKKINVSDIIVDKRSKSYKDAISKIQNLNPELTREECVTIFDDEFASLDK